MLMERIQELLAKGMDNLEPEELQELTELCAEQAQALAADPTDENLTSLEIVAQAAQDAREENERRLAAEEERQQRANELLGRVNGDDNSEDESEDTEESEGESEDDESEEEEAPATISEEEEEQPDAVAAGANQRSSRRPARRPFRVANHEHADQEGSWSITGDVPGFVAGSTARNGLESVADAIVSKRQALGRGQDGDRIYIARFTGRQDNARRLAARDPARNTQVFAEFSGVRRIMDWLNQGNDLMSITAAGGICAPATTRYDFEDNGTSARPFRDSLPTYPAPRGKVEWFPPITFTDVDGGVDTWTIANDENPSDPSTKPCVTVDCGTLTDAEIQAFTRCAQFGNLDARAFPERVQHVLSKLDQWFARYTEQELLGLLDTALPNLTSGQVLGAARDIPQTLERYAVSQRYLHRLPEDYPFDVVLPFWVKALMRTDLGREQPGGQDRLVVDDAYIMRLFTSKNLRPTFVLDHNVANQRFTTQGVGPLQGYPNTVIGYIYPTGAVSHLDNGTLDLGLVRDSTLNSTNDYQMFAETFEGIAFWGETGHRIEMDVCADGSTSAPIDINPCVSGS